MSGKLGQDHPTYQLSGIDFERLRIEFSKSPYKETALLTLQERIQQRLDAMLRDNPSRIDFYEHYKEIINEYNHDKNEAEIQRVFEELLKLHDSLDDEEKRYVKEGFDNDQQLAVFDLLRKDVADIEKRDIKKIKKVAVDVLVILEERKQQMTKLRDRATMQAQLKASIIDKMLDDLPEEYSNEDIEKRADWVFRHIEQQIISKTLH